MSYPPYLKDPHTGQILQNPADRAPLDQNLALNIGIQKSAWAGACFLIADYCTKKSHSVHDVASRDHYTRSSHYWEYCGSDLALSERLATVLGYVPCNKDGSPWTPPAPKPCPPLKKVLADVTREIDGATITFVYADDVDF